MTKTNIKRTEVYPGLIHLVYPNGKELAESFLRPMEFHDSQQFRGKVFTLAEFKKWYIANSEEGKKTGKFTYYEDWDAFNLTDLDLEPFFAGRFNPLSRREETLLNLVEDQVGHPFSTIGTPLGGDPTDVPHEISHGLFYLEPQYKQKAMEVIRNMDKNDIKTMHNFLGTSAGYDSTIFDDEVQAYTLASLAYLEKDKGMKITPGMKGASRQLNSIFNKFLKLKKS